MEILYWFVFFGIMIFLSFLSWFQIFLLFLLVIFITNQINVFSYLSWIFKGINNILNKFSQTSIGFYCYQKLISLEKSYQFTKSMIKKEIMKILLGNNQLRNFTPRLSRDVEDTDSD
jgi:hypothetical protein